MVSANHALSNSALSGSHRHDSQGSGYRNVDQYHLERSLCRGQHSSYDVAPGSSNHLRLYVLLIVIISWYVVLPALVFLRYRVKKKSISWSKAQTFGAIYCFFKEQKANHEPSFFL